MQKAKYAELEAHKLEHKRLVDQLDQLRKQHLLEEKSIYFELLSFLKKWLREHIMGVDTKYCLVLQQAGFSMAVSEHEASAEFRAMIEMTGRSWKLW